MKSWKRAGARCGLASLLALSGLTVASSASAAVTSGPTWQVSANLPGANGVAQLVDVVATGPDDAWAGGTSSYLPLIEHWDGTSWTNVTPIGKQFHTPATRVDAIGASSPANVWGLVSSATNGYAIRWNGSSWMKFGFRGYIMMNGIAVESRRNVWAFGMTGDYRPFVRRFNGTRWKYVAMPGVPMGVSALSWKDIYAIGPTTSSFCENCSGPARDVLMQWNGRAWHSIRFPSLNMNRKQLFAPAGVVATRNDGVWVTGDVQRASNAAVLRHELLHWTGKRWQVIPSPVSLGPITSDGSGGLWMTDVSFNPAPPESFVHFSNGKFELTSVPLPAPPPPNSPGAEVQMSGIGLVPGTTSVWSVGAFLTYGTNAIIYQYRS